MTALALLSGGLDSLVAAAHAARHGGLSLALTFDYGQRAFLKEKEAAAAVSAALGCEHRIVGLPFLAEVADCGLTRRTKEIPGADAAELDDAESGAARARQVWVPNRNGVMIHAAACFAEALGLDRIVVGFNAEEAATFPDNRAGYLEALNEAFAFTLNRAVRVESPLIDQDKKGIVRMGLHLKAPLHLVWSCYEAGPRHCMRCESCLRLRRALQASGQWESLAPRLQGDL